MSWTKVISKRSGFRWDVFPFGGMNRRVPMAGVTSFYVSEFPEFFNAKRLFELFGCSGNVAEVAISPRRNSVGKRFAFARFLDVEDGRILAIRLDNILIEGKKLHVNFPRYNRSKGVVAGRFISSSSKGHGGLVNPIADSGGNVGKVYSGGYSGWKGSHAAVVSKGQVLRAKKEGPAMLVFQSDKDLKSRFEKAYLGRVCLPGSAYNIQNYLEMEGVFAIKVTPLGGNCCLLEELEVGFIGDLIKEGESWWKSLFSVIEKWEAGKLDGCRDVWFRIYGVPLHVWCPEFFVALGEVWGRFMCIDANTSKGEAFDVARIMVNIPLSLSIPEVVSVCIDGVNYNLCVREDAQCSYKQAGGIKKTISPDTNYSDSSDSESDRLMVESVSGGSVEAEELEGMEGTNPGDSK